MDSKRILVLETMILTFGLILILGHCVTEASEPPRVQGLNERHETNSIRSNANSEAHDPDNLSADHRPPSCRDAASHEASPRSRSRSGIGITLASTSPLPSSLSYRAWPKSVSLWAINVKLRKII